MSTGVITWSQTGGLNATSDTAINFAEGQAPSSVNDSARNLMASVAKWRDDIHGFTVTGGTGSAYTLSSNQGISSNVDQFTVQFNPGATNTGAVTLSVDGQTARPLRFLTGVDLPAGVLVSGSLYQATYRANTSEWLLHSFNSSIYSIPVGGGIDYWGSAAPNSCFALAQGQAISRTTYATLFGLFGTTYGVGDGSTTFNIPDKVGRVSAMVDGSAARLTAVGFGTTPVLGASGGLATRTLLTANLPAYTPAGTISNAITVAFNAANISSVAGGGNSMTLGGFSATGPLNLNAATIGGSSTFTGTAQGGTSTPVPTVQPTIICNYIIRVL